MFAVGGTMFMVGATATPSFTRLEPLRPLGVFANSLWDTFLGEFDADHTSDGLVARGEA